MTLLNRSPLDVRIEELIIASLSLCQASMNLRTISTFSSDIAYSRSPGSSQASSKVSY